MNIFLAIVGFLIAICVLVIIHELGHFLVARWCHVKVLRFSFGFGPPIWKRIGKKHKTEFVIAPIPLGGYVKFLDSRETTVASTDKKYTYDHQSAWRRLLILLAGPFTNFLFAVFAFSLMFTIGIKLPKPIIGRVTPNSPASMAGVAVQSEIIGVDAKKVHSWQDIVIRMMSRYGEKGTVSLQVQTSPQHVTQEYSFNLQKWQSSSFRPDPLQDFGIVPYHPFAPSIIGDLESGGAAVKAGLAKGDVIVRLDQQRIKNWDQVIDYVKTKPRQKITVVVQRNSEQHKFVVELDTKFGPDWKRVGYMGVRSTKIAWPAEMVQLQKYDWWYAPIPALKQVNDFTEFNWVILTKLVTGKISLHVLGGPLSVFQTTAQALQRGPVVYLGILALISVTLGFVNLLPIPGLDGGHVLITIIEGMRRKMLANATQVLLMRLGMVFLLILILQATFNDVVRLLT